MYVMIFGILNCKEIGKSKIDSNKYYIYSKKSGNNIDYFFRMGNDSFCYDFTNSKIYTDFSHPVITDFRNEIVANNVSFITNSNEIKDFEIDSIVYYNYSNNGLINLIYSNQNISQINYNFDKKSIDTTIDMINNNRIVKFKLLVKFLIFKLNKSPFHIDTKDQTQKPITDMMFYKLKGGVWDCISIPYNSSYFNFFNTFLPR